jgi:hypothetical protein
MIDPLEAAIAYFVNDADLHEIVGNQIAAKHLFGEDWTIPSRAVTVHLDGGEPDIYNERQKVRLEVRCYGETQYEATRGYLAMVNAMRAASARVVVETNAGKALIYWLVPSSGPSFFRDPDVGVDTILFFCSACVAEQDV